MTHSRIFIVSLSMLLTISCNSALQETEPSSIPQEVTKITPAKNATDIFVGDVIIVDFSGNTSDLTLSDVTFVLDYGMTGQIELDIINKRLTYTPDRKFSYDTFYTVDVLFNNLNSDISDFSWSFTTQTDPAPRIVSYNPQGSDVAVESLIITILFDKPIDEQSLQGAFTLLQQPLAGIPTPPTEAPYSLIYYPDLMQAEFQPNVPEYSTTYIATLSTEVTDLDANTLTEALEWTFTTMASGASASWVAITTENQGQTAKQICQSLNFTLATQAKRCASVGGGIININQPYSHTNCLPGAQTYAECFNFLPCNNPTPELGVVWDSIFCE